MYWSANQLSTIRVAGTLAPIQYTYSGQNLYPIDANRAVVRHYLNSIGANTFSSGHYGTLSSSLSTSGPPDQWSSAADAYGGPKQREAYEPHGVQQEVCVDQRHDAAVLHVKNAEN